MSITSVKDNRNNRWKRNTKKEKKTARGKEAIAKKWEINDIVERLKLGFIN